MVVGAGVGAADDLGGFEHVSWGGCFFFFFFFSLDGDGIASINSRWGGEKEKDLP